MAGGTKSWLVGGGILALGAVAAMPFYRGNAGTSNPTTPASSTDLHWDGDPLTLRVPGTEQLSSSTEVPLRTTLTPLDAVPSTEPPSVDGEYGGLLDRFGGSQSPQQLSSEQGLRALSIAAQSAGEHAAYNQLRAAEESLPVTEIEDIDEPPLVGQAQALITEQDEEAAERMHTIVDGDTLERIAHRYYNDPFYAKAIFERNRGVLSDPQLLPVGLKLVIPPRQTVINVQRPPLEAIE